MQGGEDGEKGGKMMMEGGERVSGEKVREEEQLPTILMVKV